MEESVVATPAAAPSDGKDHKIGLKELFPSVTCREFVEEKCSFFISGDTN